MQTNGSSFPYSLLSSRAVSLGRQAALAALGCVCTLAAPAQQVSVASNHAVAPQQVVAANDVKPLDLTAHLSTIDYTSSSSSSDAVDTALPAAPSDSLQPPPRRRYGRPRYNDSSHNPDGSPKYTFIAGVGATIPLGNTYHYDTGSYGFQVGGGRNFNKHFAVIAQYDYDHFGLQGSTLGNQTTVYNSNPNNAVTGLDGNAHIWSFTLNPTYTFYSGPGLGAYVVGGVGFYHKVTNFTLPEQEEVYTIYGPEIIDANAIIDHYTSNAVGFNGGLGLTYKPSRFSGERFYLEARYVFIDNQQRTGQSVNNINDVNTYNQYPANSNRTTYIPVKVGIRF